MVSGRDETRSAESADEAAQGTSARKLAGATWSCNPARLNESACVRFRQRVPGRFVVLESRTTEHTIGEAFSEFDARLVERIHAIQVAGKCGGDFQQHEQPAEVPGIE